MTNYQRDLLTFCLLIGAILVHVKPKISALVSLYHMLVFLIDYVMINKKKIDITKK